MANSEQARMIITGTLQGVPVLEQLEEFSPPDIEREMQDVRGGRYIADAIATGVKRLSASVTLNGASWALIGSLGIGVGDEVMLDVRESGRMTNGGTYSKYHSLGAKVEKITEKTVKMGDLPATELTLAPYRYTRTENGVPVININTRTQVLMIGGVDLMAEIRRLVMLP